MYEKKNIYLGLSNKHWVCHSLRKKRKKTEFFLNSWHTHCLLDKPWTWSLFNLLTCGYEASGYCSLLTLTTTFISAANLVNEMLETSLWKRVFCEQCVTAFACVNSIRTCVQDHTNGEVLDRAWELSYSIRFHSFMELLHKDFSSHTRINLVVHTSCICIWKVSKIVTCFTCEVTFAWGNECLQSYTVDRTIKYCLIGESWVYCLKEMNIYTANAG